jgi:hypothetical protein
MTWEVYTCIAAIETRRKERERETEKYSSIRAKKNERKTQKNLKKHNKKLTASQHKAKQHKRNTNSV